MRKLRELSENMEAEITDLHKRGEKSVAFVDGRTLIALCNRGIAEVRGGVVRLTAEYVDKAIDGNWYHDNPSYVQCPNCGQYVMFQLAPTAWQDCSVCRMYARHRGVTDE